MLINWVGEFRPQEEVKKESHGGGRLPGVQIRWRCDSSHPSEGRLQRPQKTEVCPLATGLHERCCLMWLKSSLAASRDRSPSPVRTSVCACPVLGNKWDPSSTEVGRRRHVVIYAHSLGVCKTLLAVWLFLKKLNLELALWSHLSTSVHTQKNHKQELKHIFAHPYP